MATTKRRLLPKITLPIQSLFRTDPSQPLRKFIIFAVISIILGFVSYLVLYNRFPLYVSHVSWIYNAGGDALQHQLGWEWFRKEPWRFPLGSIKSLGYPAGTSVTYMDSIPLFAIPFKLLSPWLKQSFQYFGLWELTSVVLQMLTGMLIVGEFTRSTFLAILAASMLVLSPPMMFRAFYHSSLSAHWIILAGIYFVILAYRKRLWRPAWVVLFGLAMLIHLYYIPMLLPLWLISLFFQYRGEKKPWIVAFDVLAGIAVIFLVGYCTGDFSLNYKNLSISGYGVYSWNLNGFFNPLEFSSAFFKGMIVTGGQYEGFSYLGLGNLLILPVAIYLFPQREKLRSHKLFIALFLAAAVLYTLFALSNKGLINLHALWEWTLPDSLYRLFCLFRSSGRFIWPVFYFIVLFGLITIVRNVRFPALVIFFAVLLQFMDLQPLYQSKKMEDFAVYHSNMQSEFWQAAASTNQHVVVLPVKKVREFASDPLAIYAIQSNMTLNYGYFARSDGKAIGDYANTVWNGLTAGKSDNQTLYLFSDPAWIKMAKEKLAPQMFACEIDGYTLFLSPENRLKTAGFDLASVCSIPRSTASQPTP